MRSLGEDGGVSEREGEGTKKEEEEHRQNR
jgi:hypothetical protein